MAVFPMILKSTRVVLGVSRCLDKTNAWMLVKKIFHLAHTRVSPEDVQRIFEHIQ